MFDLVVSKDYKKMMQENQIELTDWERQRMNMYKAQVYYNTHTVKKWYFKYIFLRM